MKPSLIDKIISQSEFFENGVVLESEKKQIFKSNYELKHSSAFDQNDSIHNQNLHPQFDPVILDPIKEFFGGKPITVNRFDFTELKSSNVKYHIGLLKPSNTSKGKRLWMLAGDNIFVMFDSKGSNYQYFNANSANSRGRNFTIRDNDSIHKFTIKSTDEKDIKETSLFYNDVYSGKKSQSYEWFFKSISVTCGAPPVSKQSLGFYRSLFVNMQFLFIFASVCNQNTTNVDVVDAWIACAHDYLPTIIPSLIQYFIRTNPDVSEENFYNKCFVSKAILRLLSYDPEISKHTAGTATLNDILATFEKRRVNTLSKYVIFILLNEFYRKNKSQENLVNIMYYLLVNIINRSSDAYSKERIQKLVNKYSAYPTEFKLKRETVVTFRHITVLVDCIVLEKEKLLKMAREFDFPSLVSNQFINYFASGFHVLPEPEEVTTTTVTNTVPTSTITSVVNTEEGSQINNEQSAEADQKERSPKKEETGKSKYIQEDKKVEDKKNVSVHIPKQEQRLPTPPFMLNSSLPPNASTNNNIPSTETTEMKERSLQTGTNELLPAPPLENAFRRQPAKNKYAAELSTTESLNDPKKKKDEDSPKKKINHIPNYTVDESEDENTEYSFESETSEPIIIPPKPKKLNEYPKGFESDPESDSNPLPPQRNSPLKLPTKEQLDKVVGQKPSIMQDPQFHTLSSGSQDNSSDSGEKQEKVVSLQSPRDPLNMNDQQAPLSFGQEVPKQSTSNNPTNPDTSKPSTSDSRPIQLTELKIPPQMQTQTTSYTGTTGTTTTGTTTTTTANTASNITNSNTIPITPPTPKEFDNVKTDSPKNQQQEEQNELAEIPKEEKQDEQAPEQKAEDDSSQNPSKTESKTESRSIRSAADNPNYDSIDTNTESPNMYTYPDSSDHD